MSGRTPVWTGHADAVAWSVLTAAPWAIIVTTADGAVVYANDHAADLFGAPRSALIGRHVEGLLADRRSTDRTGSGGGPMTATATATATASSPAGTRPIPVEIARRPLAVGDDTLEVTFIEDITARLGAEQQLAHAERALAVMADHRRIARDLHDTVIQRLFGTGLTLHALTAALGEPTRGKVQSVIDGLNETIEVLRAAIVASRAGDGDEPG